MMPRRDEDEPADGHMDPDTRAAYRRLRERLFGLPLARTALLQLLLERARGAMLSAGERARSGAGEEQRNREGVYLATLVADILDDSEKFLEALEAVAGDSGEKFGGRRQRN